MSTSINPSRNDAREIDLSTMTMDTVDTVQSLTDQGYKYGFVSNIEADEAPPGLSEDTARFISAKKGEPDWLLEWRLPGLRAWRRATAPKLGQPRPSPLDSPAANP